MKTENKARFVFIFWGASIAVLFTLFMCSGCSTPGAYSGSLQYQNASGQNLNYDYKNVVGGSADTPRKDDPVEGPNFGPAPKKKKK